VWKIIQDMNEVDKKRLFNHMQRVLNDLDVTDVSLLMTIVGDPTATGRDTLVRELGNFFGKVQKFKT